MRLPRHYRPGTVTGASGRADVVVGVGVVCGLGSSGLGAVVVGPVGVVSGGLVGVVVSPGEVVSVGLVGVVGEVVVVAVVAVVVVFSGAPVRTFVRGTQV